MAMAAGAETAVQQVIEIDLSTGRDVINDDERAISIYCKVGSRSITNGGRAESLDLGWSLLSGSRPLRATRAKWISRTSAALGGKRHALIVVLGYSRPMWLRYYECQGMPVVMRGLESAFRCCGGVPSELPADQMKAVIIAYGRAEGGRIVENPEFLRCAHHWGFRIRARRP